MREPDGNAIEPHAIPRDGQRSLTFNGHEIGRGRYASASRETVVTILVTTSLKLVYEIYRNDTNRVTRESRRLTSEAYVFDSPEALRDWLQESGEHRYGAATAEAWEQACEWLGVPDDYWSERV